MTKLSDNVYVDLTITQCSSVVLLTDNLIVGLPNIVIKTDIMYL